MMRNPEQTVGNLIDKSSMALISYIDDMGYPITKAMLKPREREGIRVFWFTTNTSSNKVKCYRVNPKASIYFADRRFFRGVSLSGTVEVLESAEAKERIWARWRYDVLSEGCERSRLLRSEIYGLQGQVLTATSNLKTLKFRYLWRGSMSRIVLFLI